MAEVDPDQEAALRRLRTAFGFVEILRIVDHHDGHRRLADRSRPWANRRDPPTLPPS